MQTATLYTPADADQARRDWLANCGPCAVAALLGRPVMDVRPLFPMFPQRAWVNPTGIKAALCRAGVQFGMTRKRSDGSAEPPRRGLAFVQWDGPWSKPDVPVIVAYRETHWIGIDGGMVYDVNADGWVTQETWRTDVVAMFREHDPRIIGWWLRAGIEVWQKAGAA